MEKTVLVLEPFYGGSHKQMIDLFLAEFQTIDFYSLPAKKWHWRAGTSALYFSKVIPLRNSYTKLFCSSVLNLTELIGLRPDLAKLEKTIYMHENQLVYPVLEQKNRDFHFGYSQIVSCLTADHILFNSSYNMTSFLDNVDSFLKLVPSDSRPRNLSSEIRPKCQVVYFPMVYPSLDSKSNNETPTAEPEILHIVWNHRWEHDKNPETFFKTLFRLKDNGYKFHLSVLGECYDEKPEIFDEAKVKLTQQILHWGFLPTKSDYYSVLKSAHVVVSTAKQECFGISILEATYCGCFPVCPNDLSYPEIYSKQSLYSTDAQLYKILKNFCKFPCLAVQKRRKLVVNYEKYDWRTLRTIYEKFLT